MRSRLNSSLVLFILLMIGCATLASAQGIVINEIQSGNTITIADEDGAHPDWVEIYNSGSTPVDLLNYGLSDDLLLPFKWTFPSVTVQPGAYLLVFASDKNRKTGPYLHTNFSIKAGGEPVLITRPDGQRVSEVAPTAIPTDQSFGRQPDGENSWYFFSTPTPGTANTTTGYREALPVPIFSQPRGFYNLPFSLVLTSSVAGATIRYTLDGSDPTEASPVYSAPISIQPLTTTRITGYVRTASGLPIRNAIVQVNGYRGPAVVTGNDGRYDLPIASSPLQIFADALGYTYSKETLTVAGNTSHDIVLTAATETGVIQNGGFEQRTGGVPNNWAIWGGGTNDKITASTTCAGGTYSGKFTPTASGINRYMYQEIPVTPGYTYNCYYKIKADAGVPTICPLFSFRNDANEEIVGWVSTEPGYTGWEHAPSTTTFAQYCYHGLYTESLVPTPLVRIVPPAGATKMIIWFGVSGTPWNGKSIYVDDVVVDKVPADASPAPSLAPSAQIAALPTTPGIQLLANGTLDTFKTTVVRAKCFKTGYQASPAATHTYFVGQNAATRYTLPIVSLATDRKNFFDSQIGIYVGGYYNNFNQTGDDWERPIHVEFFEAGGPCGFQCDAGVRIHGGWTRNIPQKSLRLYADHQNGPGSFNYKIFPDSNITDYKRIILRNSGNDNEHASPNYTLIRDGLMQELVKDLNIDLQNYRPAIVFFNGEYWGIHSIQEREDKYWLKNHHPEIDSGNLDLIQQEAAGTYDIGEGDTVDLDALNAYIRTHDLAVTSNYEYIKTRMDIDELLPYFVAEIYFANTDWPGNNIRFWRERNSTSKWRWAIHDTDFGFGLMTSPSHDTLGFATARGGGGWPNPDNMTIVLASLLRSPEFRSQFINTATDMMNSVFVPETVDAKILAFSDAIAPEVAEHFARWGNAGNRTTWEGNVYGMRYFAYDRPYFVRNQFVKFFSLAGTAVLSVNAADPAQGQVKINTVTMPSTSYSWQGTFFQEIPVTLTAIPAAGYKFVRWEGAGLGTQNPATITLSEDTNVTPIFEVNP